MSGNTFAQATPLQLNSTVFDSDFVDLNSPYFEFDINDYWVFSLSENNLFELNLRATDGSVSVGIYDNFGNLIPGSNFTIEDSIDPNTGSFRFNLSGLLNAGTYYVGVVPTQGFPNYSFTTFVSSSNPDGAGNTPDTARLISVTSEVSSFNDSVGTNDQSDIYRFTLNDSSQFELNLTGLSQSDQLLVAVGLYDELINTVDFTSNFFSNNLIINRQLDAGTYYIDVYAERGSTDYQLNVSASTEPVTLKPDNAGNSLDTAREISLDSTVSSFSDAVSNIDFSDFYRFTLNNPSEFDLNLTGLSREVDVALLDNTGSLIELSANYDADENINILLEAGTYYLEVYYAQQSEGQTDYQLNVSAVTNETDETPTPPTSQPDNAGNTLDTAREISVDSTVSSFNDYVDSATDRSDIYEFTINDPSELQLNLTGLSQSNQLTVTVGIYDEVANEMAYSFSNDSSDVEINTELEAGTYYIEIDAGIGNTDYQLNISAISDETVVNPPTPPTSEPPTSEPPISEPPTSEPPISEPPTSEPPTPLSLLDSQFYRFSNRQVSGTYLFASGGESVNIRRNFANVFSEDGPAFKVATQEGDNLLRFNRFANTQVEGTYLFATEGESISIRRDFGNIFTEEGIAFYAYGADANVGTDYYRLANTQVQGTYLFVNRQERDSALAQFPNLFRDEGIAFEVG